MRVGMAGLAALYWPYCIANGLFDKEGVEFTAAATLGETDGNIINCLGASAGDFAEKYRLKLYSDPKTMVEKEKLDTVVVIAKHSEHAGLVELLAPLGVDLYIPKTFATTKSEADRIVEAGRKNGVKIAVGPSGRYLPEMLAIKKALDSGAIGKPFSMRICHHHGVIDCFNAKDWYRNPREGGPELSLGWYGIDLILHFLGSRPLSVSASYGNYNSPDSPFMDCGRISLNMENGANAAFDMYFCNRMEYPSWQMEIIGDKGALCLRGADNSASSLVASLYSSEGYKHLEIPKDTAPWENVWINDFLSGNEHPVDAAYAALVTDISLAAREAAEKNSVVAIS